MKTKTLVLGSSGLIGHHLCRYFEATSDLKLFNIANSLKFNDETILIDAININKLKEIIEEIQPDYIFNCIGILNDKSDNDPTKTIFLNAYLPNQLGEIANTIGAKLIHFSTDCIFSGNKKKPYNEDDNFAAYE